MQAVNRAGCLVGIFNWPVDESASMILAALKVGLQQQEAPVNVYMIENSAKSAEQACVAFHVFGAKAVVQPLSEAAVTAVSEIEGSARWEVSSLGAVSKRGSELYSGTTLYNISLLHQFSAVVRRGDCTCFGVSLCQRSGLFRKQPPCPWCPWLA